MVHSEPSQIMKRVVRSPIRELRYCYFVTTPYENSTERVRRSEKKKQYGKNYGAKGLELP